MKKRQWRQASVLLGGRCYSVVAGWGSSHECRVWGRDVRRKEQMVNVLLDVFVASRQGSGNEPLSQIYGLTERCFVGQIEHKTMREV